MAPPAVRADYDQLKKVANRFSGEAQAVQKSLQLLQRELDVLQGGDWVGTGATAFYQEMGGQVMPTLKRLTTALQSAQQTTLQIHQIMAQAETEAARWLRGEGSGDNAGAGGMAGPLGAVLAGPGTGGGSGGGGAAAPASPQDIAASVAKMVEQLGAMGPALGLDRNRMAAAAAAGAAQGLAGASPAVRAAVMQALEAGAVDRKLSAFSQGARDMIKQSPTLRAQVFQLEQKNYNFKTGAVADGYYTDHDNQTIVIDQPLGDADTVAHIAHEVGHGVSSLPHMIPATPTMTRDQYVQRNVDNYMQSEGEAQFNVAQVRAELKAAGSADIGITGSQTADYQKVYDDYTAGTITKAQAISQMGNLMGNEQVSTPPYQPYRESYRDAFRKDWDDNIAPTRSTP